MNLKGKSKRSENTSGEYYQKKKKEKGCTLKV